MEQTKYDFFISYSRKDLNKVKAIKREIEQVTGMECWMDLKDIKADENDYLKRIAEGIEKCRVFLFMLSKSSQESKYAVGELVAAKKQQEKRGIHVVIINVDGCEMSTKFTVRFTTNDVILWSNPPQKDKLIRNLRDWLGLEEKKQENQEGRIRKADGEAREKAEDNHKVQKNTEGNVKLQLLKRNPNTLVVPPVTKRHHALRYAIFTFLIILSVILLVCSIYWLTRPSAASLYQQGMALYDNDEDDEAFPLLLKSAEMGYDSAQYMIGEMYYIGAGVEENDSEALRWYKKAAEQGHGLAQLDAADELLHESLYSGNGSLEEAIKLYEAAAAQGVSQAQYQLSKLYYRGLGVEKDEKRSFDLCRQAAMNGNVKAQVDLGDKFLKESGTEKNVAQAVLWYKAAAEQGDDVAQNYMGQYYLGYYGGNINKEEALHWFIKSAKQGNSDANYYIGNIYSENGEWAEATEYYQKAADKGQADALFKLGFMYWYGYFALPKNTVEGMNLLKKAAEKGNSAAMCLIGEIYENGLEGYNKNIGVAKEWYEKAAARGNKKASTMLEQLGNIQLDE